MENCVLSNEELLTNLGKSIKQCKLFQMYLKDVADDYGKYKIAKLRFEFARHEYLNLFQEVKARGLNIGDEERDIAKLLFH